MNDSSPTRQDKFRAYRARKKAKGLREIRMWVPDVNAPGFQEKLAADMRALRGTQEEQDILKWTEALRAETWKDLD